MPPLLSSSLRVFTRVGIFLLIVCVFTSPSTAALDIAPGESAVILPDHCAEASGFKLPTDPTWGNCLTACYINCNLGAPSADAKLSLLHTIGSAYATSTIYGQFSVADPNGSQNEVDGQIRYDLWWKGLWSVNGAFTGYNEAKTEISVYLYDVTASGKLVKKTEPPVHTMTPDGFIGIDLIDIGSGYDSGATANTMAVKLVRGHTYRLALTLNLSGKGLANADIDMDYGLGDLGVYWNEFVVSVSPDLEEQLAQLTERVDSLEAEVARLRHNLENHSHTYLTGRGEGHNNAEAQTSIAIIMEDDDLSDSTRGWLETDDPVRARIPVQSIALTNYPNPFNPSTTILYSLPEADRVKIAVYNSLGQIVTVLVDEFMDAGEHTVEMEAAELASGIYYYRLTTQRFVETRKLVLLK